MLLSSIWLETLKWHRTKPEQTAEAVAKVVGPLYYLTIIIGICVTVFTITALVGNIISLVHGMQMNDLSLATVSAIGIIGCLFLPIAGIICMYVSIYMDKKGRNLLLYVLIPAIMSVVFCLIVCLFGGVFLDAMTVGMSKLLERIQRNSGPFIN